MKEAEIQMGFVDLLRKTCEGVVVISNPLSELEFQGSEKWKWKVLRNAKAKGWEASQSDLQIFYNGKFYAVELKTEKENPFRFFHGSSKNGYWVEKGCGEKNEKVRKQAAWLDSMRRNGAAFAGFVSGWDQMVEMVEIIKYGFSQMYGVSIWRFNHGKYIPEVKEVMFLEKMF